MTSGRWELGLDLAECLLLAAQPAARDGALAHRRLAVSRVPHAQLHRDRALYLLLPEPTVGEALAGPLDGAGGVGISDRIGIPGRVPHAAAEARWTASGRHRERSSARPATAMSR